MSKVRLIVEVEYDNSWVDTFLEGTKTSDEDYIKREVELQLLDKSIRGITSITVTLKDK